MRDRKIKALLVTVFLIYANAVQGGKEKPDEDSEVIIKRIFIETVQAQRGRSPTQENEDSKKIEHDLPKISEHNRLSEEEESLIQALKDYYRPDKPVNRNTGLHSNPLPERSPSPIYSIAPGVSLANRSLDIFPGNAPIFASNQVDKARMYPAKSRRYKIIGEGRTLAVTKDGVGYWVNETKSTHGADIKPSLDVPDELSSTDHATQDTLYFKADQPERQRDSRNRFLYAFKKRISQLLKKRTSRSKKEVVVRPI